ncbi:Got1 family protein [Planoprotostelium fungivorum]|uniref:Got1 family protein n=1 Tax=Planoprotostelium fungivorum TaxID=1890364 RepID=A0A2P6NXY6_9EUKA|nr:Got1 family protein [Planoprotostelium fungivorum]
MSYDEDDEYQGWVSESQKVGIIFLVFAAAFGGLGFVMFLDTGLLSIANLLLLIGLSLCLGAERLKNFFINPQKLPFTLMFSLGIFLLLNGYSILGFLAEMIGFFMLFKEFIPLVRTAVRYVFSGFSLT